MEDKLKINRSKLKIISIILLLITLPLILSTLYVIQNTRSSAAAPDKLEAEAGVLTSSGVSKQSDSGASGGQFIRFAKSTSGPTPTSPPLSSNIGPRPAPSIPTGSNVVYVPTTIADNNSGDVGSALQSFINGVPNGSIVVFDQSRTAQGFIHGQSTPDSIYRMGTGITINNKSNITLWGYNSKFNMIGIGGDTKYSGFWIENVSNIKILGFEIEGINTKSGTIEAYTGHPGEWSMGVGHRYESNGTEIADTWIHHVNGDGIYTACWGTWPTAGDYNWHHNKIELNGRQGITLNQTKGALIENNIINDNALYNIDGEDCKSGTQKLTNVIIRNNELARQTWGANYGSNSVSFEYDWNDSDGPPALADFGPFTLENNIFKEGAAPTSYEKYGNCGITHISINSGPAGTRSHDVIVRGNKFEFLPQFQCGPALKIGYTDRVTVTNNDFQGMTINITNSTSETNSGNK